MRSLNYLFCICVLFYLNIATAGSVGALDYSFEFSMERSAQEGVTLGDDLAEDRLTEEDFEFEIDLEYQINDSLYLFLVGAFIDETETIDTANLVEDTSGFERKEVGLGYYFGDSIRSEFNIGRMEFESRSDWFAWWDEELDGLRLKSTYGDFETMLGLTEEQARESTGDDFIDPERKDVKRSILSVNWEVVADHSLVVYYLDQNDDSKSFISGELEDFEQIDEEDADLSWTGISYFGEVDYESVGTFEFELHTARVSGDETLYEFDDPDPATGLAEVEERIDNRVSGTAQSYLLNWIPSLLEDWTLVIGNARGSGDRNPDNRKNGAFRQTGLQGDSETFGELYQPELSNLTVDVIGFHWRVDEQVEVSVLSYKYKQRELADEMRDVSIELDTTGLSRDLGREIDIIITIEADNGLEFIITAAEFDPGEAYGNAANETSNFINVELAYEF